MVLYFLYCHHQKNTKISIHHNQRAVIKGTSRKSGTYFLIDHLNPKEGGKILRNVASNVWKRKDSTKFYIIWNHLFSDL